jgi:hypothetical protein
MWSSEDVDFVAAVQAAAPRVSWAWIWGIFYCTSVDSGVVHSQFGFGCLCEEKLSRLLLALALAQQLCGPTKRRLWSVCAATGCPLILRSHGEGEACQSNLRN